MEAETLTPHKKGKKTQRKKALFILLIVVVIVAIVYFSYWFLVLSHYEETDDAYVMGNQIQVTSQVPGSVVSISVDDTDLVHAGDILVSLDSTDAEQNYKRAETALANSVRQVRQLMINSKQYQENIALKTNDLQRLQQDLARREVLGKSLVINKEDLQHARDAVTSAQTAVQIAQQQYNANQAIILNTPLKEQPMVKQAAIELKQAWLALQRTKIRAPVTGYVSQRNVQVGNLIASGAPLMAIVPSDQLWINANFKETQLTNINIGQSAKVTSDYYGNKITYMGKVAGIDMGTGSAFSLLPAQNATGNWIKVVQRLPVRIEINPEQLKQHPLRIGLSTLVEVNTQNQSGVVLKQEKRTTPAYQSSALLINMAPIDKIIDRIISENSN